MSLFEFDQRLLDDISARFDLRSPNAKGLRQTVFELSGQDKCEEITLNLATGVGKTYVLAALLEYAAVMGVTNLLVVMPGKTVRTKTIANFTPGAAGFIQGAEVEKAIITPANFTHMGDAINAPDAVKLFLLNVDHLTVQETTEYVVPGSKTSTKLRTARDQETLGGSLLDHLRDSDDLLMVLDESHSFSSSAATWKASLDRLGPAARVGMTATPTPDDKVIFSYSLPEAINDRFVKTPVVAIRPDGYRGNAEHGQLKDAKALLEMKAVEYLRFEAANPAARTVNPVMLVACRDIEHAGDTTSFLRQLYGQDKVVLEVHSSSLNDEVESELAKIQEPGSPVRAVVQVDMLNEGWDVRNVAVLVPLRTLDSARLTEQMIGRGLRLPYGTYTGNGWVDSLDILSHQSIKFALAKYGLGGSRDTNEAAARDTPTPVPPSVTALGPSPDAAGQPGTSIREIVPLVHQDIDDGQVADGEAIVGVVADLGGGVVDLGDIIGDEDAPTLEPALAEVVLLVEDTFRFPLATFQTDIRQLQLSNLDDAWVAAEAAKVGLDDKATLDRKTVIFTDKGVKFDDAEIATIADDTITAQVAAQNILPYVLGLPVVKQGKFGPSNLKQTRGLVTRFIQAVSGEWTYRRALGAGRKLVEAIKRAADAVADSSLEEPVVTPLGLPKRKSFWLPTGHELEPYNSVGDKGEGFDRQRYYDGWKTGLYSAAQFDAWSTEFRMARLMDRSPKIAWWMRLYRSDEAKIEYGNGRFYYPDFVAEDTDGIFWVIEGKDESGKDTKQVQDKRAAAEKVIRLMDVLPEWHEPRWGYLIAYQNDVGEAQDWGHLKSLSNPVLMNPLLV